MVGSLWWRMAKGSSFERRVCRRLSEWWDPSADDVLFWRTAGSGGRATVRRKTGRKTNTAHAGDIAALGENGAELTRLIAWELKCGYQSATIHQLLDRPKSAAVQHYEEWIGQAVASARAANAPYWAVVHDRSRRETVMLAPVMLFEVLDCFPSLRNPVFRLALDDRWTGRTEPLRLVCCHFEAFLNAVTPARIRRVSEKELF